MFDETLEWIAIELSQNYSNSLFTEHHPLRSRKPASDHGCLKTLRWEVVKGSSNVKSYEACFNAYVHTCWDNSCFDWHTSHSVRQLTAYMSAFICALHSSVRPLTSPRYRCWLAMVENRLQHICSWYFSDMQRESVSWRVFRDAYSHVAFIV